MTHMLCAPILEIVVGCERNLQFQRSMWHMNMLLFCCPLRERSQTPKCNNFPRSGRRPTVVPLHHSLHQQNTPRMMAISKEKLGSKRIFHTILRPVVLPSVEVGLGQVTGLYSPTLTTKEPQNKNAAFSLCRRKIGWNKKYLVQKHQYNQNNHHVMGIWESDCMLQVCPS